MISEVLRKQLQYSLTYIYVDLANYCEFVADNASQSAIKQLPSNT